MKVRKPEISNELLYLNKLQQVEFSVNQWKDEQISSAIKNLFLQEIVHIKKSFQSSHIYPYQYELIDVLYDEVLNIAKNRYELTKEEFYKEMDRFLQNEPTIAEVKAMADHLKKDADSFMKTPIPLFANSNSDELNEEEDKKKLSYSLTES